jgi:hypothetical protein
VAEGHGSRSEPRTSPQATGDVGEAHQEMNMQNGNFSATIVVNGIEVADQMDATVPIAFGDEYVVRLRTHHGRRAVADIWVDGVHITPDGGVVVPSYGYADVETPPGAPGSKFRFVDSDSHDAHVAGKGGPDINGEKGLIRVDFRSERAASPPTILSYCDNGSKSYGGAVPRGLEESVPTRSGVTVAGSSSSQSFRRIQMDIEPIATTILLKLKGRASRAQPAYVKQTSRYCIQCGRPANLLANRCPCGAPNGGHY